MFRNHSNDSRVITLSKMYLLVMYLCSVYIYIVGHKILQLTERSGRCFFIFVSDNIQNTTVIFLGKKSLIVINKQTIVTNTSMIRHAIFAS